MSGGRPSKDLPPAEPSSLNIAGSGFEGLLFFALSFKEMLFDYTLDSFKARLMNPISLAEEIIISYGLSKDGILSIQSINPIREELLSSTRNDFIIKNILDFEYDNFIEIFDKKYDSLAEYEVLIQTSKIFIEKIEPSYAFNCINNIFNLIIDNKEKKDILYLSSTLLTELFRKGYSQRYLYCLINEEFFGKNKIISTEWAKDLLISLINKKYNTYDVYMLLPRHAKQLVKFSSDDFIASVNKSDISELSKYRSEFTTSTVSEENVFVKFKNIKSLEHFSARIRAEERLGAVSSFIGFILHELNPFPISLCIVFDKQDYKKSWIISNPKHSSLKRSEAPETAIDDTLSNLSAPFLKNRVNKKIESVLVSALRTHLAGTRSKSIENQFINLWTSLETIACSSPDRNTIQTVHSCIIPILCYKYYFKILKSIFKDVNRCYNSWSQTYVKSKCSDKNYYFKFLTVLIDDNEKAARDEFNLLSSNNPLLRHRVFSFSQRFTSKRESIEGIDAHEKRIDWHLSRIYRNRNQLIHAGIRTDLLQQLTENLHDYVDSIILAISYELRSNYDYNQIDDVFNYYKTKYNLYKKSLSKIDDNVDKLQMAKYVVFGAD